MTIDVTVLFEGRRWPGAHWPMGDDYGAFGLRASGRGRPWQADRPLAFWRNFSALDLTGSEAAGRVQAFLACHGEPDGEFDRCAAAGRPIESNTLPWPPLIRALKPVAAAWDAPDPSGISRMSGDPDRLAAADKALRRLLPPDSDPEGGIEVVYAAEGLALRPRTLGAFMALSAASARARAIAMRECLHCDDWFELRRNDAVFCSGSCQVALYRQRHEQGGQ